MRTVRRFAKDESGMTLALAMMMILLTGVMGAGLLTFASKDLNSVIEANRGQRAFELADAGVGVAKRQLSSDAEIDHYNGGTGDIQWSADPAKGGATLTNLDGEGATPDSVHVTIEYKAATDAYPEHFQVISEGTYGVARRKVEAIFEMTVTAGVGSTPAFYTQSDIKIKKRVTINGVSLFSERNITIEDIKPSLTPASFKADYEGYTGSDDVLTINNSVGDELGDWNIPPWNTVGRKGVTPYSLPYASTSEPFEGVGLAAEGKICGSSSCQSDSPSVADGVYGYDSTTGTKGNMLRFAEKINCSTGIAEPDRNPNGTTCSTPAQNIITYPFERTVPDPVRLKQLAQNYPGGSKYHLGSSPPWNTLFNSASANDPKVVFIDAQGSGVTFNNSTVANNYGILVVWCGKLTLESDFKGVIVTLHGNELPGGTTCGAEKGGFVNKGRVLTGFAYAEGDVGGTQGIELQENSVLNPLTGPGRDQLLGYAFGEGASEDASVSVGLTSWRELYE
jgi:hypothetical protein